MRAIVRAEFFIADFTYCFTVSSLIFMESAISFVLSPQAIRFITSNSFLLKMIESYAPVVFSKNLPINFHSM
jgi:hypothetical protein